MNIEELAFKDKKILANLNAVDLLNIIEFLQGDSRQCLEEHNKLKEEITNLSKDVDMWNAKYNDIFDENRMLKKQLENYKKLGFKYLQDKNNNLETQQKAFIKWLEDYINLFDKKDIYEEGSCDMLEGILQKYRSIIGGNKDENNKQ